jgi:DNA-binding response OmpR family regulator
MSKEKGVQRPVIVLIEEETQERLFLVDYLKDGGFDVLSAEDTDAGLKLLDEHGEADALVTDAHVPGSIDGFELARVARERWPNIMVVMTSGHSDETSGPLPEGAVFVVKPDLTTRLLAVLRNGIA